MKHLLKELITFLKFFGFIYSKTSNQFEFKLSDQEVLRIPIIIQGKEIALQLPNQQITVGSGDHLNQKQIATFMNVVSRLREQEQSPPTLTELITNFFKRKFNPKTT